MVPNLVPNFQDPNFLNLIVPHGQSPIHNCQFISYVRKGGKVELVGERRNHLHPVAVTQLKVLLVVETHVVNMTLRHLVEMTMRSSAGVRQ